MHEPCGGPAASGSGGNTCVTPTPARCPTPGTRVARIGHACGAPVHAPRGGPQHCTPGRQLSQSHTSGQGARTRASQLPVSALEAMSCNMTPTARWGWPWRHGAEACLEPSGPAALRPGCTGPQKPQANYQIKSNPLSKHDPGLEPGSPALQEDSLSSEPPGKP